jgi:hypothetical protein
MPPYGLKSSEQHPCCLPCFLLSAVQSTMPISFDVHEGLTFAHLSFQNAQPISLTIGLDEDMAIQPRRKMVTQQIAFNDQCHNKVSASV